MGQYFNFGSIRPLYYFFGISGVLGVVFAFISENQQKIFVLHLILWLLQTMGPILILVFTHIALHKLHLFERQSPWIQLAISGMLGAFLFSPIALSLDILWENDALPNSANDMLSLWKNELMGVVPPITLCWIAINSPWLLGYKFISNKPSNNIADEHALDGSHNQGNASDFFALIDQEKLGDIIYIKSELHYLLVVGTKGKELILYNLRDAMTAFPKHIGAQAHRSYWVNFSQISRVIRNGRQARIIASNAAEIPISRGNIASFKGYL